MGMQKEISTRYGVTLNYWRLNRVDVDIELNSTICRVGGYVSKTDALAGKTPLMNLEYSFRGSANPITLGMDPRDHQSSIEAKIVDSGGEEETDLERVQRLSLLGVPGLLVGATIVSDLPD